MYSCDFLDRSCLVCGRYIDFHCMGFDYCLSTLSLPQLTWLLNYLGRTLLQLPLISLLKIQYHSPASSPTYQSPFFPPVIMYVAVVNTQFSYHTRQYQCTSSL